MAQPLNVLIVSDIHYAGPQEQARGHTANAVIDNPWLRLAATAFRHFVWLRHPFRHNSLLDQFLDQSRHADYAVALGDYSCDSAFVGVSDDAACASAQICLDKLRHRFGPRFRAVLGDHELGKMSLFGGCGGMRLASWHRAQTALGLTPFWQLGLGCYQLIGVTSSLLALPIYEPEILANELPEWQQLRAVHRNEINRAFAALKADQRVLLFCHDPTAIPFLWQESAVRDRLDQVEQTWIGHLHSDLILWKGRLLAGMPAIRFLGNSIRRMSTALHEARCWQPFKVHLCPALTGIELLKDGGFCSLKLDPDGNTPVRCERHRIARHN